MVEVALSMHNIITPSGGDRVGYKPGVPADTNTRSWTFCAIKAPFISKHMLRPRQQTLADKFSWKKLVRLLYKTMHHFLNWAVEYVA